MSHVIDLLFFGFFAKFFVSSPPFIPVEDQESDAITPNTHEFFMSTQEGQNLIDWVNADMGRYAFHNMFVFPHFKVINASCGYTSWYLRVNDIWRRRRMGEFEAAVDDDTRRLLTTLFAERLSSSWELKNAQK